MIFIHVGKSKTGTTSIQLGLKRNRKRLLDLGYLYPKSGIEGFGHHNIFYDLSNSNHFEPEFGTFRDLVEEIKAFKLKWSNGHVILSSETFEVLTGREYGPDFHPLKKLYRAMKPVSYTHLTLPTILRV